MIVEAFKRAFEISALRLPVPFGERRRLLDSQTGSFLHGEWLDLPWS